MKLHQLLERVISHHSFQDRKRVENFYLED